jgi:hypothetical protein
METELAARMNTSRSQLDRLLDPESTAVSPRISLAEIE